MRALARAAAAIRAASARVSATGFSHTTWYPCSSPHMMSSRWEAVGVQISMKSSGARSRNAARSPSRGIPSTGGTAGALSTMATTSTRPRRAAPRNAGKCDCRAMPPAPIRAPRYRPGSGDAGVGIVLRVEQAAQGGGIPLVHPQEHHEQQAHPHRLGPQEHRRAPGEPRDAEHDEADVLPQPRAQGQHGVLAGAVLRPEGRRDAALPQGTDELHRAGEQLDLSHHVIAVHAFAEPLAQRAAWGGVQVLGEVELTPAAYPG